MTEGCNWPLACPTANCFWTTACSLDQCYTLNCITGNVACPPNNSTKDKCSGQEGDVEANKAATFPKILCTKKNCQNDEMNTDESAEYKPT